MGHGGGHGGRSGGYLLLLLNITSGISLRTCSDGRERKSSKLKAGCSGGGSRSSTCLGCAAAGWAERGIGWRSVRRCGEDGGLRGRDGEGLGSVLVMQVDFIASSEARDFILRRKRRGDLWVARGEGEWGEGELWIVGRSDSSTNMTGHNRDPP